MAMPCSLTALRFACFDYRDSEMQLLSTSRTLEPRCSNYVDLVN